MSTESSETLNIGQLTGVPHAHTKHNSTDNNPAVASDARAKIEALHAKQAESTLDLPVHQEPLRATQPTSPAMELHKTLHVTKKHHKQSSPIKSVLIALAAFLLLVLLFKAPVLITQAQFLLNPPPVEAPVVSQPLTTAQHSTPTMLIPKINVNVPIVFEPSTAEASIQKALENGVVHYGNTPVPGQAGNSVIVGHSSNDWWEAGNYKFAFVLLDKLIVGDTLTIDYNGTRYIYETTETKVVEATDLSVLKPTRNPTITLITCWPIGTNLKRFIVHAKQVSPKVDSNLATPTDDTPTAQTLPGNATSFTTQITEALGSLSDIIGNKPTNVKAPGGN